MAARKKSMTTEDALKAKILAWMREFDGVSIQEVGAEFGISDVVANNALVEMSNDDLIDTVAGGMWAVIAPKAAEAAPVKDETPAPAPKRTRRTKAQMEADKAEERERLEYATRAAETQDEVMSQSPQVQQRDADLTEAVQSAPKHAKPVQEAEEPVKAADGTNVTVPVSEGSEERRELDAAKGERVISEDWIPGFVEPKNVEEFTPPTILPAVPAGVTENTWFMAHCADTKAARTWWMTRAQAQMVTAA